jgi:hypothetical protein
MQSQLITRPSATALAFAAASRSFSWHSTSHRRHLHLDTFSYTHIVKAHCYLLHSLRLRPLSEGRFEVKHRESPPTHVFTRSLLLNLGIQTTPPSLRLSLTRNLTTYTTTTCKISLVMDVSTQLSIARPKRTAAQDSLTDRSPLRRRITATPTSSAVAASGNLCGSQADRKTNNIQANL